MDYILQIRSSLNKVCRPAAFFATITLVPYHIGLQHKARQIWWKGVTTLVLICLEYFVELFDDIKLNVIMDFKVLHNGRWNALT